MNYDQLTDEQLSALVAEKVMGWHLVWFDRTYHQYDDGWSQTGPYNSKEECQKGEAIAYWQEEKGNCLLTVDEWLPALSMDAAMEVVTKLTRDWPQPYLFELEASTESAAARFRRPLEEYPDYQFSTSANPARAICLAALTAAEKENN